MIAKYEIVCWKKNNFMKSPSLLPLPKLVANRLTEFMGCGK